MTCQASHTKFLTGPMLLLVMSCLAHKISDRLSCDINFLSDRDEFHPAYKELVSESN